MIFPRPTVRNIPDKKMKLLLNFQGANGSSTFTDKGPLNRTISKNLSPVISTTQSKFTGSSLKIDESAHNFIYTTLPNGDFGTTKLFHIGFFMYVETLGSGYKDILLNKTADESGRIMVMLDGSGNLVYNLYGQGVITGSTVSTGTWHYIDYVGTSSLLIIYLDGTAVISASRTASNIGTQNWSTIAVGGVLNTATAVIYIDDFVVTTRRTIGTAPTAQISKFLKDPILLITKGGLARWTLQNTLADSFGSYTLTNSGLTFSQDSTFPTTTRYVAIANGSSAAQFSDTGLPSGSASRSMSAWVKTSQTSGWGHILNYGLRTVQYQAFAMSVSSGNFVFTDAGATQDSGVAIADGKWHHIAVTFNSPTLLMYLDGILVATKTASSVNTVLNYGKIGTWTNTDYITGSIGECRIYNRVLTAAEILKMYNDEK